MYRSIFFNRGKAIVILIVWVAFSMTQSSNAQDSSLQKKEMSSLLPVLVMAKKGKDATKIIMKILARMKTNQSYSFDQCFRIRYDLRNYDTIKEAVTEIMDLHFDGHETNYALKRSSSDTSQFDKAFFRYVGGPRGNFLYNYSVLDRVRTLEFSRFLKEAMEKKELSFKVIDTYKDSIWGDVYKIVFMPVNMDDYLEKNFWCYDYGSFLVTKKEYVPVYLDQNIALSDKKNVWYKRDRYDTAFYGKEFKTSNIVPLTLSIRHTYVYQRDKETGQYFLQSGKKEYHNTGFHMKTEKEVRLDYNYFFESIAVYNKKMDEDPYAGLFQH